LIETATLALDPSPAVQGSQGGILHLARPLLLSSFR
jgi:hypothetical protein